MADERVTWSELTPHLTGRAHLATATGDGVPHASVVLAGVEGETIVFLTRASSGKARNIAVNAAVALMWSPEAEVYVSGRGALISERTEIRRVWESGVLPYDPPHFFGSPDNADLVLVRVTPLRATLLTADANGIRRHRWSA